MRDFLSYRCTGLSETSEKDFMRRFSDFAKSKGVNINNGMWQINIGQNIDSNYWYATAQKIGAKNAS